MRQNLYSALIPLRPQLSRRRHVAVICSACFLLATGRSAWDQRQNQSASKQAISRNFMELRCRNWELGMGVGSLVFILQARRSGVTSNSDWEGVIQSTGTSSLVRRPPRSARSYRSSLGQMHPCVHHLGARGCKMNQRHQSRSFLDHLLRKSSFKGN